MNTLDNIISFSKFPEAPAPWSSMDAGDAYEWGDYYLTLQRHPKFIIDIVQKAPNRKPYPLRYLYALSVFYKPGKNPSGVNSIRPTMILTIEQIRLDCDRDQWESPMFCVFAPNLHVNISDFSGPVTAVNVCKCFFEYLSNKCSGSPVRIGTIHDVFTRLDKHEHSKKQKGLILTGWLLIIGIILGLACLYETLDGEWKYHKICVIAFISCFGLIIAYWGYQCLARIFNQAKIAVISIKSTNMSDSNKILLFSTITDLLLLGVAIIGAVADSDFVDGYYTFLRIVTCVVLVWHCMLLRSPYWRFFLAAGAILYNPIIPIHLDDHSVWCFFNIITVAALLIAHLRYRNQLKKDIPNEN